MQWLKPAAMIRAAIAVDAPLTSAAAVAIAEAGGNAVDITVAAALTATLSETLMCSLGGSGFLMVQTAGRPPELIDGADVVPSGDPAVAEVWDLTLPYGDGISLRAGPGSVAVPGLLACLHLAWRRHGSLPWPELVRPALELARRGWPVGVTTARWLAIAGLPLLGRQPASRACFLAAGERPLTEGERLHFPGMVDTLELVARQGSAALYGGELGAAWAETMADSGGLVTLEDLATYRAVVRRPLRHRSAGFQLALNPPPARGGAALDRLLALMERSPEQRRRGAPWLVDQARAQLELARWRGGAGRRAPASTTQISVLTAAGDRVSLTLSSGYGAGITIPGTGIACNNSLGEPELNPGGYLAAAPGTRLPSNMAPTLASHGDGRMLAFGSPGASRITTALAQVWWRYAMEDMDLEAAIAAPRLHVNPHTGARPRLLLEPGFDPQACPSEIEAFELRCFDAPDMYFGGVKLVAQLADGSLQALADPRRGGSVAVTGGGE
jgi:gamma-glutamyltranspeptidase/glutathione hydrolase